MKRKLDSLLAALLATSRGRPTGPCWCWTEGYKCLEQPQCMQARAAMALVQES